MKPVSPRAFARTALSRAVLASAGLGLAVAVSSATAAPAWFAGDLHVHDDHSSDGSLPRQCCDDQGPGNVSVADQIGFAELLGLDFLPLTDHRTYDQHYDPLWRSSKLLLIPAEEANGSPHATVHGAIDTVVQGSNPPGAPDFVNLQQSIWDAHTQDAVWVTAHPDDGEMNDDDTANARASAQGVDLVETWNHASNVEREIAYAEDRWNRGFRFGVTGASDNHFRELWAIAGPGLPTTSVLAAQQTERALLDGLRAGHTRIASDPLAPSITIEGDFDGDGQYESIGGDEILAPAGTVGHLRVSVHNAGGNTVRVFRSPGLGAAPLAEFKPTLIETDATYPLDVAVEASPSWYRAEVRGFGLPAGLPIGDDLVNALPTPMQLPDQLRATTSPLFLSTRPVEAQPEIPVPADRYRRHDDRARVAIGAVGAFAGFPDLAVVGDTQHLVAETHLRDTTRVVYQRRVNGVDDKPVALSPVLAGARFPKVAARGQDVWVVWQDERGSQLPRHPTIALRHSTDGGRTWGRETIVRTIDGRSERPDIALDADGTPLLVWQEIAPGKAFDVWFQAIGVDAAPRNLSAAGKTVAAATVLDSRSARYPASVWPSIVTDGAGRTAVAWQDNRDDVDPLWTGSTGSGDGTNPDDWQIRVTTRASASAAFGDTKALGDADRADRHPSVAFERDGTLVAAWDRKTLQSSGANLEVLAAASSDGGLTWNAPGVIAPTAVGMSQYVRLGVDPDGRARAVWTDSRSADWRWRVMTARHATDGTWINARILPSPGINSWPVTEGSVIAFASTRNAKRLQRDRTQQVVAIDPAK